MAACSMSPRILRIPPGRRFHRIRELGLPLVSVPARRRAEVEYWRATLDNRHRSSSKMVGLSMFLTAAFPPISARLRAAMHIGLRFELLTMTSSKRYTRPRKTPAADVRVSAT